MLSFNSDEEAAAVAALLNRPIAWTTAEELAGDLAWEVAHADDVLWQLNRAGWIDVGPVILEEVGPEGYVTYSLLKTYCLSPFGAYNLGLVVEEVGETGWRWAAKPLRDDAPKSIPESDFERDPIEDRPDPRSAIHQVERAEEWELAIAKRRERGKSVLIEDHYYPVVFLGLSLMVWTERGQGERVARGTKAKCKRTWKGPCPGCLGRRLETHEYCLVCDAWGRDSIFREVANADRATHRPHPGSRAAPAHRGREAKEAS